MRVTTLVLSTWELNSWSMRKISLGSSSSYLAGHARWNISSTSSMIGSVTSWTINEKCGWCIQCSTFFFCPVKKLSRTITSWPSIISLSVKWDPTNPAPPVINIFFRLESGRIIWIRECFCAEWDMWIFVLEYQTSAKITEVNSLFSTHADS